MPRISTLKIRTVSRLWEGDCPVRECGKSFRIESAPRQPKIDVLTAFKIVRPRGRHVHGSYVVNEHEERGGE